MQVERTRCSAEGSQFPQLKVTRTLNVVSTKNESWFVLVGTRPDRLFAETFESLPLRCFFYALCNCCSLQRLRGAFDFVSVTGTSIGTKAAAGTSLVLALPRRRTVRVVGIAFNSLIFRLTVSRLFLGASFRLAGAICAGVCCWSIITRLILLFCFLTQEIQAVHRSLRISIAQVTVIEGTELRPVVVARSRGPGFRSFAKKV